jgi:putative transposase
MRGYKYAAGVYIYIYLVRYKMVTRIWSEGSEYWIIKNTKDNVSEQRSREELDRLSDEHHLRFDGDKDEDSSEKRRQRRLKAAVPLSGASGRLRGIMAASSDLLAEVAHGTDLLTGLNR